MATKTKLGWTVFGAQSCNEAPVFHICQCQTETELQLDKSLRQFYAYENLGVSHSDHTISKEDKSAIKQLESNTEFKGKFYETGLIWRFNKVKLPNSYNWLLIDGVAWSHVAKESPL